MTINGSFSPTGKKERGKKYHISTKDNKDPLVTVAADEKEAAAKWAKRTGRPQKDARVTPIGTRADTITRASNAPATPVEAGKTGEK